jgi:enamine deaminase RidA (YjgF/YER057c/UK114 family)
LSCNGLCRAGLFLIRGARRSLFDRSPRGRVTNQFHAEASGNRHQEIDMADSPNLRFVNPSTMSKPPGYTHVVEATGPGRIVYIAGQLGLTVDGKLAGRPDDFRAQATQAFENLKNALAAVGAGFEHVVKLNNYLTNIRAQLPLYRDVRDGYVSTAHPPASTTVEVSKLAIEGALYEVEAVAMLPPR